MTPAILVLGAPRTGTSCVAGMLAAGGARVPGPMVRNWDNAKGHFEATAAVRLSDHVLSRSSGSWMQPPASLRWAVGDEAERDRLLAPVDGRPALLKDPRMLLCWPFWSAGTAPIALLGTVRHPVATARSMSAWRRLGLDDALRLWIAHCRVLLELARTRGVPLVDLDAEPTAFLARMREVSAALPGGLDPVAMAAHYDPRELHHDGAAEGTASPVLSEALALHGELLALLPPVGRRMSASFPWERIERVRTALASGAIPTAAGEAHAALAGCADPVAVLLPLAADLLRAQAPAVVLDLCADLSVPPAVAGLLRGKALLALGRAAEAVAALTAASAGPEPFWEARSLLAQALYAARRRSEARAVQEAIANDAVHPPACLATAAEWAWRDRDPTAALDLFARAIALSPEHRRGRLRCRRAELLRELGRGDEAAAELRLACAEDPTYPRARDLLLAAGGNPPILPPRTPE